MIGRRLLALAAIGSLLTPACSSGLGATPPFCPSPDFRQVGGAIILEAQAVPSARFGPCLDRLVPGWKAHDLHAERGRAWFWLDSDRVGERFLQVTLVPECDTVGAQRGDSGIEEVSLFTKTESPARAQSFAVIPVADRHLAWAQELSGLLGDQGASARVDASDEPLSERIRGALDAGEVVLIVDDVDVEDRTAAIRTPESPDEEEPGQSFEQILGRIDVDEGNETFRGNWFLTFAGGCIIYEFDAEGPGAARVAEEVRAALGVAPLDQLREQARRGGFKI